MIFPPFFGGIGPGFDQVVRHELMVKPTVFAVLALQKGERSQKQHRACGVLLFNHPAPVSHEGLPKFLHTAEACGMGVDGRNFS